MLSDCDPDPHVCVVQSDRLVSIYATKLVAVCLREEEIVFTQHFVHRVFFPHQILLSPFYQQGSGRYADGPKRKLNKSDAQTCHHLWLSAALRYAAREKGTTISAYFCNCQKNAHIKLYVKKSSFFV